MVGHGKNQKVFVQSIFHQLHHSLGPLLRYGFPRKNGGVDISRPEGAGSVKPDLVRVAFIKVDSPVVQGNGLLWHALLAPKLNVKLMVGVLPLLGKVGRVGSQAFVCGLFTARLGGISDPIAHTQLLEGLVVASQLPKITLVEGDRLAKLLFLLDHLECLVESPAAGIKPPIKYRALLGGRENLDLAHLKYGFIKGTEQVRIWVSIRVIWRILGVDHFVALYLPPLGTLRCGFFIESLQGSLVPQLAQLVGIDGVVV